MNISPRPPVLPSPTRPRRGLRALGLALIVLGPALGLGLGASSWVPALGETRTLRHHSAVVLHPEADYLLFAPGPDVDSFDATSCRVADPEGRAVETVPAPRAQNLDQDWRRHWSFAGFHTAGPGTYTLTCTNPADVGIVVARRFEPAGFLAVTTLGALLGVLLAAGGVVILVRTNSPGVAPGTNTPGGAPGTNGPGGGPGRTDP